MADTNYFSGIVRLLENPKEKKIDNNDYVVKICAELPHRVKNSQLINMLILGKQATEVIEYYDIKDYVLIEGYISPCSTSISTTNKICQITITVIKIDLLFF